MMHAAQHGGAFAHLQQRGSWPLIAHLQQQGSWPIGRWVALRLHAGQTQNAREAWGTIAFHSSISFLAADGAPHDCAPAAGGMHLNQTHQMSLRHSSMLRCRQRHRWTAHGSWPHQMAHRTADDARHHCASAAAGAGRRWRPTPLRACSSGGWPQMARGTIARLQQRELAADGARHDCAPAAAGAGRRWHGGDMPLHLLDTAVDEGAQDQMHSVSIIMMPADSLLPLKHSLCNAGLSRCDGWEGCSWG